MIGQANRHYRIAHLIANREDDFFHPLARAYRDVSLDLALRANDLLREGMTDGTDLYDRGDHRAPDDWRREGERAARCFEIGVAFAESLEERAQVRRRADSARREAMESSTRILVVEPRQPRFEIVPEPWVEAGLN